MNVAPSLRGRLFNKKNWWRVGQAWASGGVEILVRAIGERERVRKATEN